MSLFPEHDPNSVYLSMNDSEELLSRISPYSFQLDGQEWPTVEHYFQATQFEDPKFCERIRLTRSTSSAIKLGKRLFKKKRRDLAKVKEVIMTRAIYTKCRSHPEIADRLLETADAKLVENSQFDYYWGCGRDLRGENRYGEVLMRVRAKLVEEKVGGMEDNRPA